MRPASLAPGSRQCSRPAIIRCSTSQSSSLRGRARCACRAGAARAPAGRGAADRRVDRAQQERAGEPHALERLAQDAPLERLDVDRDVGQLGHAATVAFERGLPPHGLGCPRLSAQRRGRRSVANHDRDTRLRRAALQARIDALPRVRLAHLPTPLEPCPRLSAALGGPDDLDQARRPHRPRVRRQQDPPARVPVRRRAGAGRRHRGRRRLHPVELVPPDDRGGEQARPRGGARPAARREGAGAAGQPAARPADGRGGHRGRPRQHGAPGAAARGQGRRARARRAQALRRARRSGSTSWRSARSATSTPRSSSTPSSTRPASIPITSTCAAPT